MVKNWQFSKVGGHCTEGALSGVSFKRAGCNQDRSWDDPGVSNPACAIKGTDPEGLSLSMSCSQHGGLTLGAKTWHSVGAGGVLRWHNRFDMVGAECPEGQVATGMRFERAYCDQTELNYEYWYRGNKAAPCGGVLPDNRDNKEGLEMFLECAELPADHYVDTDFWVYTGYGYPLLSKADFQNVGAVCPDENQVVTGVSFIRAGPETPIPTNPSVWTQKRHNTNYLLPVYPEWRLPELEPNTNGDEGLTMKIKCSKLEVSAYQGCLSGNMEECFSSNLPIVVVNTHGVPMVEDDIYGLDPALQPGTMVIVNDVNATRNVLHPDSPKDFVGRIGIEVRGSSSAFFDKKSYGVALWDSNNQEVDSPLLGLGADSDWILHGPFIDKTLVRNNLGYQVSRDMGQWAARSVYIELFLYDGPVDPTNVTAVPYDKAYLQKYYKGTYLLMEKIRRGGHRVDVAKLNSTMTSAEEITGGYILSVDREKDRTVIATYGQDSVVLRYPAQEIPLHINYITQFMANFQAIINGPGFANSETGYPSIIDAQSFIDQMILQEWSCNTDAYSFSAFMHKDRDGPLRAGPVWDLNLAFGTENYCADGWQYEDGAPFWWTRLAQDPAYNCLAKRRWQELRAGVLSTANINAMIDEMILPLAESRNRNFLEKWFPALEQVLWLVNPVRTYAAEISAMKAFIQQRAQWLDTQFPAKAGAGPGCNANPFQSLGDSIRVAKIVSNQGEGDYLQLTNVGGTEVQLRRTSLSLAIKKYFKATDVLQAGQSLFLVENTVAFAASGVVVPPGSPVLQYSGKLSADGETIEFRDTYGFLLWSLAYSPGQPRPSDAVLDGHCGNKDFYGIMDSITITTLLASAGQRDFLEIKNTGAAAINLGGVGITQGIQYSFSDTDTLQVGDSYFIVANITAFLEYQTPTGLYGQYGSSLSSIGETLLFSDPCGFTVLSFSYQGDIAGPCGGQSFTSIKISSLVADAGEGDYLILHNSGQDPVALDGAEATTGIDYRFPVGEILQPGESYLLVKNFSELAPGLPSMASFAYTGQFTGGLQADGEIVGFKDPCGFFFLFLAFNNGTRPSDEVLNGNCGTKDFNGIAAALKVETLAASQGQRDYMELVNVGGSTINLGGIAITQGIQLAFTEETVIQNGESLFLVANRTAFLATFKDAETIAAHLILEYGGKLSSLGEVIAFTDPCGFLLLSYDYSGGGICAGEDYGSIFLTLKISEILASAGPNDFIEFTNVGNTALNLTGLSISNGIDYFFETGEVLAPGEYYLLASSDGATDFFPGNVVPGNGVHVGRYLKNLRKTGETLEFVDPCGIVVHSFEFSIEYPWPNRTQLDGDCGPKGDFSFVPVSTQDLASQDQNDGSMWTWSVNPMGSPGHQEPEFLPVCVDLQSPELGAEVYADTVTLQWKGLTNGTAPCGYFLYFGTDKNPDNVYKKLDLLSNETFTVGLTKGEKYYWQIRPYYRDGAFKACPIHNFFARDTLQALEVAYGVPNSALITILMSFFLFSSLLLFAFIRLQTWRPDEKSKTWYQKILPVPAHSIAARVTELLATHAMAPELFSRKSIKLWATSDTVEPLREKMGENLDRVQFSGGSLVSTIYFENDDFDIYRERLNKLDGAPLLRVRYYGDQMGKHVYVEMKTHVEGEQSMKQRIKVETEDVPILLYDPQRWKTECEHKYLKKEEKNASILQYINTVQRVVEEFSLYPLVQTTCNRDHYQREDNESLRMTLDTNLVMCPVSFGNWKKSGNALPPPPNEWKVETDQTIEFPYAVLEVKISGSEVPAWVKEVMDMCHLVTRFSKYLHGATLLYDKPLPPWFLRMEEVEIAPKHHASYTDEDVMEAVEVLKNSLEGLQEQGDAQIKAALWAKRKKDMENGLVDFE